MKLYDAVFPGTRGSRVRWMLEEIGAPYEVVALNPRQGDNKTPAYLAVHPHGSIPAMEIDGQNLIESAAIVLHLADLFPQAGLAPAPGTPERGAWYQWCVYAASTLDDPIVARIFHALLLPEARRDPAKVASADALWRVAGPFLSRSVEGRDWLLGDRFSAADVVVGYDLRLANTMGMLAEHPPLAAYMERLAARPAYSRAFAG